MADETISILQPASLTEWSVRVAEFSGLEQGDCIGRCLPISEQVMLKCPRPIFAEQTQDAALFFRNVPPREVYDFPLPDVRLDAIPAARLVGGKFVVVSRDRRVFSESYWSEDNLHDQVHFRKHSLTVALGGRDVRLPLVLFRERPHTGEAAASAVLIGNPWAANYHHWIINCLGRLWIVDQFPELRTMPLVVPQHLSSFQRASLAALGIAPERLLPFDGGAKEFRRLYFPANGDMSPTQLRWIRQRCYEHLGLADSPGGRLLYISRADADGRRVANEAAVTDRLKQRGFEVLQLGAMPLADQVRTLAEARVVVGPHGSGLTNVLFGSPHLSLLELHPDDEVNQVFWVLASALQQKYAFLSGRKINAQRDFTIDIDRLDELLVRLL